MAEELMDVLNEVDELGELDDSGEDTQKGKFMTFRIGEKCYGIAINYVSEIISAQSITPVPEVEDYVNKNRHIELKDTAFHYFLNVSDFRTVGQQEPYEFARPKVKDMVLNLKQVEFMRAVKDDLYQQAVKRDKIKYN